MDPGSESDETAYDAITAEIDDHRWAFGTGFSDPLAGVDTSVPAGIDGVDLAAYCEMLADDALVLSHRLQEWLARAPELEEETALANIALDLLGQARLLYARAGAADGTGRDDDAFAFERDAAEFRNVALVEGADADFGGLIARLLVFSCWRLALLGHLRSSADSVLSAIAGRGVNEVTYHRDYASQWTLRLGDGTDYSHARIADGLRAVAPFTGELFRSTDVEQRLSGAGVAVDPAAVRAEVFAVFDYVLAAAGLSWPKTVAAAGVHGRDGVHTPALGTLVTELQSVARANPGAIW
jgi:ring-1,2-phenylacetyl-CoA epoxidase subunit PaaC